MQTEEMVQSIKRRLGSDILDLEITDDSIKAFIKTAFKTIQPYIVQEDYITFPNANSIDLKKYNVVEVVRVYPTRIMAYNGTTSEVYFDFQRYRIGTGYDRLSIVSRLTNISNLEDYEIPFRFDQETQTLQISYGNVLTHGITAEVIKRVTSEDLRDQRAEVWIESYALGLCKEAIGRIRSKFTDTSVPVQMDGKDLVSEGKEDQEKCLNQLKEESFGPTFVVR